MQHNQFIHQLCWSDIPLTSQNMSRRCLLDLLGVAASGTQTQLSRIIRKHAVEEFGGNSARLLFDGRTCSASGAALANGMTIDSIDAHDGFKPVKGHAGCGVLAALLAFAGKHEQSQSTPSINETELLTCLVIGYEIACRAGIALHGSVSDFHTSGAWVSLAAAALGARTMGLNNTQTAHALGIAEYHGPRSQMMRCIDHPTMVKDGSGWGAMAGVSAALLAKDGFTGAPAITITAPEQQALWSDLGSNWLIEQQYFKPFPVCRWAQSAVIAALNVLQEHGFDAVDIESVSIGSFHESVRLATANPDTTEQAQYSLPFPVAAALVHKQLSVNEIQGAGLQDKAVHQLSQSIKLYEVDTYNDAFPLHRISEISITLKDGRVLQSGPTETDGDPEMPLDEKAINNKFDLFATPLLGALQTSTLRNYIRNMGDATDLTAFNSLIYNVDH